MSLRTDLAARVRDFVERHCIPLESNAHVHDPRALDAALSQLRPVARELGLYLPQMPVEEGGLGLSWVERAAVFEEAGRSYLGPAALNCAAPDQPNMISLLRQGTLAQRQRYLQPLAEGRIRSCFAMTEPAPGAGSDPSMLRTTARREGDGWVIDGHKWFITGAVGAAFCIVLAQTEEGPTQFIVDMEHPGLSLVRAIKALDPYAVGGHGELRFTACRVGGDAVLGEVGQGLAYAQQRLEPARTAHEAQAYVCERSSFGERLADLQQVQAMVADCHIDLHASRLMSLDCARRMDEGLSVKTESAMTKVFVSEALGRIADRASQLCGALGMSEDDSPVALIVRELRPFRIYDGASELHRATLGRRFLKT